MIVVVLFKNRIENMLMIIKDILRPFARGYRLSLFVKKWKKRNGNNYTVPANRFPMDKVFVGKDSYGTLNIRSYGNPEEQLIIGNYCSIAEEVVFLLSGEHPYKGISTYPFKVYYRGDQYESICKGPITIEDDVWIGYRATILSGVTIHKGAIVGAGSVVACDIPPYAIFAGGEIIKYRFPPEIIERLCKANLLNLSKDDILNYMDDIYCDVSNGNIRKELWNVIEGKSNE